MEEKVCLKNETKKGFEDRASRKEQEKVAHVSAKELSELSVQELRRFIVRLIDRWGELKFEEGLKKATKGTDQKYAANGGFQNSEFAFANCTLKDKILLYLSEDIYNDGKNPLLFSRAPIASSLGVAQSQISRTARKLLVQGNILKKRVYVPETGKFRDVYELTPEGAFLAREVKDRLEESRKNFVLKE